MLRDDAERSKSLRNQKQWSMSKERRRKSKQKSQSRWLLAAGVALALSTGLWFVFSNRKAANLEARPISKLSTADFHSLAFSPTEPETVFFGHHDGLLVSHNGGKDWQPTTLTDADAMSLGVPSSSPQTMYAAGHNVFVKSNDRGKTWQSVPADLPGLDIHAFAVYPENANRLFAYVVSFGLFGSENGGISWEALSLELPTSVLSLTLGKDDQTLYATTGGAGLWESGDRGRTWALFRMFQPTALSRLHISAQMAVYT